MDSLFDFIISSNFTHGWPKKDKENNKNSIIKVKTVMYIKVLYV